MSSTISLTEDVGPWVSLLLPASSMNPNMIVILGSHYFFLHPPWIPECHPWVSLLLPASSMNPNMSSLGLITSSCILHESQHDCHPWVSLLILPASSMNRKMVVILGSQYFFLHPSWIPTWLSSLGLITSSCIYHESQHDCHPWVSLLLPASPMNPNMFVISLLSFHCSQNLISEQFSQLQHSSIIKQPLKQEDYKHMFITSHIHSL